jgi:hypothetical protein
MAQPSTRQQLIDYCKRQLGAPVLQINIDDDQVSDIIDDAIQFYQEFHYDGIERMYLKHKLTPAEITRFQTSNEITTAPNGDQWESRDNYIQVPDHVIGVSKVFGLVASSIRSDLFGIEYQIFLNDLYAFGSLDILNYFMTKQYLETLDMVLNNGSLIDFRFNKRQDRLYIDVDTRASRGGIEEDLYLLIDCHRALDPSDWSQVYNDSFLKRYATALMKRQWGANLIKFNNVQLPGGITLNGRQIWEDGNNEVKDLESRMISEYSLPPLDMIG